MALKAKKRREEIDEIWRTNQWLYVIVGFLGGLLFFPCLSLIAGDMRGLLESLVPEFLGIVFTVFLIDRIYAFREQDIHKKRLITLISSRANDISTRALEELRAQGWLKDGSLYGAQLKGADLTNASFVNANICGVSFVKANLNGARFKNAKFDENTILPDGTVIESEDDWDRFSDPKHPQFWIGYALTNEDCSGQDFEAANLVGADLWNTNFSNANLQNANFNNAELKLTNFRGAILLGATLQGAVLNQTAFDETTILPNGYAWNAHIDMSALFGCVVEDDLAVFNQDH